MVIEWWYDHGFSYGNGDKLGLSFPEIPWSNSGSVFWAIACSETVPRKIGTMVRPQPGRIPWIFLENRHPQLSAILMWAKSKDATAFLTILRPLRHVDYGMKETLLCREKSRVKGLFRLDNSLMIIGWPRVYIYRSEKKFGLKEACEIIWLFRWSHWSTPLLCLIGGHGVKRAVTHPRPREGRPDAPRYCMHFPSLIHHLVGRGLEHFSVQKKMGGSEVHHPNWRTRTFSGFFRVGLNHAQPPVIAPWVLHHFPFGMTSIPLLTGRVRRCWVPGPVDPDPRCVT